MSFSQTLKPFDLRQAFILLVALYSLASLAHFVHNAEYLALYPNMPGWITRAGVYGAWLGVAAVGVGGGLLHRLGFQKAGLLVLGLYGGLGLDGLMHYSLAPVQAHSLGMNLSIWAEALSGAALLVTALLLIRSLLRR